MKNLISLSEKLNNGEKIECKNCHKGIYIPYNSSFENNKWFKCNKCGDVLHFEPKVEVK